MAVKSLSNSSILQPFQTNSMLGDYESNYFHHLETVRLGASAASVSFTNLAKYSDYQHLQIRITSRAGRANSTTDPMIIKLNGNTQTKSHALYGNGSSVNSYAETTAYSLWDAITGPNAAAGAYGAIVIDLLDAFDASKNKTMRALTAANTVTTLGSVLWATASATSSLEFTAFSGTSFLAGSRFSLYGIKARS